MDDEYRILDEHGQEVSPDDVDMEKWNPNGASFREHQDAVRDVENAQSYVRRVEEGKRRLEGDPTEDDLADLERDMDRLEADMPPGVRAEYRRPAPERQAERVVPVPNQ